MAAARSQHAICEQPTAAERCRATPRLVARVTGVLGAV